MKPEEKNNLLYAGIESKLENPWEWLSPLHKKILLDLHPQAEMLLNETLSLGEVSESEHLPYLPVGSVKERQGNNLPYLPTPHHIVKERCLYPVTIYHPNDNSFSKTDNRTCMHVLVPRTRYGYCWWENFCRGLLRRRNTYFDRLTFTIYSPSHGDIQLAFLRVASKGASPQHDVYVPLDAFRYESGAWDRVVKAHTEIAVGYYTNPVGSFGPSITQEQIDGWAKGTAELLDSPEAQLLKEILEDPKTWECFKK